MKLHLVIGFLLLVSHSFAQTPVTSPTPTPPASPEKARAKTFGSSLKKYKPKERRGFQDGPKSNKPDDVETIQVTTDLVVNDVLVTDQNGKMVTDLNRDDFVVTEDGAPQKIEVFSSGESLSVPRSMVLIIDCNFLQAPYLKNSIQAAKMLVDRLAPQDKMAIVTVDVKLVVDFTADKTLLKNKLSSLLKDPILESRKELNALLPQFKDDPRLSKRVWDIWEKNGVGPGREFEALLAVLNEMFDREDRQRIVIFQGDGNEIIQLTPDNDTSHQIAISAGGKRERDLTERKQQRILNSAISKKPLKDHERRSIQWLREFDFLDSQMKSRKHGLSLRLQISIELLGDGGNLLRDCVKWINRQLRNCC